jgi:hypothetical protein
MWMNVQQASTHAVTSVPTLKEATTARAQLGFNWMMTTVHVLTSMSVIVAVINVIMSARTQMVALCVPAVLDLSWMMMEFPVEISMSAALTIAINVSMYVQTRLGATSARVTLDST